jgi:pimeloyl-ACP methyl ester carboxylesterase
MQIVLTSLGALFLALILLGFGVRLAYRIPRIEERGSPSDFGLAFREASIPTTNDKRLFGWFVPPSGGGPAPALAVLHGWGGNAESMLSFVPLLHREGYGCLLLDARNHGRSDSDSFSSLPRFAEDLERGMDWLRSQSEVDARRVALLGHSVGAAAALLVASRREDVAAVVSIASFAHPAELMRRQLCAKRVPYYPLGWLVLRYIEHAIGASFDAIAPRNTIRKVRCPVLLVHGEADSHVPLRDAETIHANGGRGSIELLRLPHVAHNSAEDIERHGHEVIEFLRRTLI